MARLRAFSAFDMRSIVPPAATVTVAEGAIAVVAGARATTLTGDIAASATGVSGTVLAFGQTLAGQGGVRGDRRSSARPPPSSRSSRSATTTASSPTPSRATTRSRAPPPSTT